MLRKTLMAVKSFFAPSQRLYSSRRMFRFWDEQHETPSVRPSARPTLEIVEERILLSAANMNPLATVAVASPPAAPSAVAMASYLISTMDQVMATAQQELRTLVEIIAQEEAYVVQQVDHLLGISTSANPTVGTASPQSGSGSGSDSGATPSHPIDPKPGDPQKPPVTKGSGIGFDAGPGSGGGLATIYGQVWLDNNGNGIEDNSTGDVELGYSNVTVWLCTPSGQQIESTLTDPNGDYQFSNISAGGQPPTNQYEIQVIFPFGFMATIQDEDSDINAQGFTPVYTLAPNEMLNVPAGFRSMNVNTTADDANGPLKEKITLRDAIETGNNGPPAPAVTFIDTNTKQGLVGVISLQKDLPDIQKSYNVDGSQGDASITVSGAGSYSIFIVDEGVTSTIDSVSIESGLANYGGGVRNKGNLTLRYLFIGSNEATYCGGGVYNDSGGKLLLSSVTIANNEARGGAGLYNFTGSVRIRNNTAIQNNTSSSLGGGGIENNGGTIDASWNTEINDNTDTGLVGGGVENDAGSIFDMTGGSINGNTEKHGNGGGVFNSGSMYLCNRSLPQN